MSVQVHKKRIYVISGIAAFALVATVLVSLIYLLLDSRQFLGVDEVVEGLRFSIPEQAALVDGIHDVTTVECHGEVICTQAAKSTKVTIFHFERKEDANSFAKTLGTQGLVSDRIVVRVDDVTIATPQLLRLQEYLDGIWSSE